MYHNTEWIQKVFFFFTLYVCVYLYNSKLTWSSKMYLKSKWHYDWVVSQHRGINLFFTVFQARTQQMIIWRRWWQKLPGLLTSQCSSLCLERSLTAQTQRKSFAMRLPALTRKEQVKRLSRPHWIPLKLIAKYYSWRLHSKKKKNYRPIFKMYAFELHLKYPWIWILQF